MSPPSGQACRGHGLYPWGSTCLALASLTIASAAQPRFCLAADEGGGQAPSIHEVLGGHEEGQAASTTSPPAIESQDSAAHLTYATIMFYKARRLLQASEQPAGQLLFKAVEAELRLALQLADAEADDVRRRLVKSQASYMLGDLAFFVEHDVEHAKAAYQESLNQFPDHDGAQQALKRFEPTPEGNARH